MAFPPYVDMRRDYTLPGQPTFLGRNISISIINLSQISEFVNWGGLYRIEDYTAAVIDPANGQKYVPGQVGYAQAAIRRSQVTGDGIEIPEVGITGTRTLKGGYLYAPYITINASPTQFLNGTSYAFFAQAAANPDGLSHIRVATLNRFEFEDTYSGGDGDYNDLKFTVSVVRPGLIDSGNSKILDLTVDLSSGSTSLIGRYIAVQISAILTSEGSSNNPHSIGFYRIENEAGAVLDPQSGNFYLPGNLEYQRAAIRRSLVNGDGFAFNNQGLIKTEIDHEWIVNLGGNISYPLLGAKIRGGFRYAPFLIPNHTRSEFLGQGTGSSIPCWTIYPNANNDGQQHVAMFRHNGFAFDAASNSLNGFFDSARFVANPRGI